MDIESIFSPGGELESALPFYSFRRGQYEMAELVESALETCSHAIIEAGTGTGKSFAYLVPMLLSLANNRSRRFIAATSTTTLQKQLYDKDIPILLGALSLDLPIAILYGRGNYLCIRRFNEARNEKSSAGGRTGRGICNVGLRRDPAALSAHDPEEGPCRRCRTLYRGGARNRAQPVPQRD